MTIREEQEPKSVSYANRSVLVGASLLRTISGLGGPATLQEISEASGMLPARTHRYLLSLVKSGLLEYNRQTGRYDLGSLVIELGLTALGRIDAVRAGSDALFQLTDRTGLISTLTVWGSNGPTIVKCEQGRLTGPIRIREGANLPLLTSATGRIFLTYMPEAESRDLVAKELERAAKTGPQSLLMAPAEIEAMCAKIRHLGLATNLGVTGHDALAAPVFNYEGRLSMVMTVLSPARSADMSFEGNIANEVRASALNLSRQLGARPDTLRNLAIP